MENMDIKLIGLVESHPVLYNKNRGDKHLRDHTWKKIAKIMDQNVEVVMARWLTIRQRFSRERGKIYSGADIGNEWELLKYLAFLDRVVKNRKAMATLSRSKEIDNLKVWVDSESLSSSNWDPLPESINSPAGPLLIKIAPEEEDPLTDSSKSTTVEISHMEMSPRSSTSIESVTKPSTTTRTTTRKIIKRPVARTQNEPINNRVLKSLQNAIQGMNTIMESKATVSAADNADDIFGHFVVSQLKLVTDSNAKKEKIRRICNVLFE